MCEQAKLRRDSFAEYRSSSRGLNWKFLRLRGFKQTQSFNSGLVEVRLRADRWACKNLDLIRRLHWITEWSEGRTNLERVIWKKAAQKQNLQEHLCTAAWDKTCISSLNLKDDLVDQFLGASKTQLVDETNLTSL
ncbi:MAG: hypothetical protein ACKESB_03280 [Candidatus Hodgkinia cicadicola]